MRSEVVDDFKFGHASELVDAARDVLLRRFVDTLHFENATDEEDMHEATDLVAVGPTRVAMRWRKPTRFRDWTIRSWRASGKTTELEKLICGKCDLYFYGWQGSEDWMLIDLRRALSSGFLAGLSDRGQTTNTDEKTGFVSVDICELRARRLVIESDSLRSRIDGRIERALYFGDRCYCPSPHHCVLVPKQQLGLGGWFAQTASAR